MTNQLNSRIRGRGLTAWEILHQRDHETGNQLEIDDEKLMRLQENTRITNQHASAKHKAHGGSVAQAADVVPGSLVYIKSDLSKNRGRECYMVVDVQGNNCILRKLLKSKIMSKDYVLKLTEVMLVTPDTICRMDYDRGLDSSDDEDVVPDVVPPVSKPVVDTVFHEGPTSPEPTVEPMVVTTARHEEPTSFMHESAETSIAVDVDDVHNVVEEVVPVTQGLVPPPENNNRRSARTRNTPAYLKDYEL